MRLSLKKSPDTAEFKFKVTLAMLRGDKTTAEICAEYGVVSSQIFKWKKTMMEQGVSIFKEGICQQNDHQKTIDNLHATIGKLKVENDFLERCAGRRCL